MIRGRSEKHDILVSTFTTFADGEDREQLTTKPELGAEEYISRAKATVWGRGCYLIHVTKGLRLNYIRLVALGASYPTQQLTRTT